MAVNVRENTCHPEKTPEQRGATRKLSIQEKAGKKRFSGHRGVWASKKQKRSNFRLQGSRVVDVATRPLPCG